VKSFKKSTSRIRLIIANFSLKERVLFVTSIIILVFGVFGLLITISNKFTVLVPTYGGTYHEGIIGSPRFINPVLAQSNADQDLSSLIYSGLVRIQSDGTIVPDLAQSWEISPDGKTYTVILKEKLSFHDREPVDAYDVVFTVEKIQDITLKSPSRVSWVGVTVTAPDAQTVVFTLEKPFAGFLAQLTLGIIPEHIWGEIPENQWMTSEYNTEPIGTGPYRVNSIARTKNGTPEVYELSAFKKFSLGKPYIKQVKITSFANGADAYRAYQKRDITGIAELNTAHVNSLKNNHTQIVTNPLPRVFGIFLNAQNNKVLGDQAVVQAIHLGINKQELVDKIFHGYATILNGPLPQMIESETTDFETRKTLAAKVLDNAGWKVNTETGIREKGTGNAKQILEFSLATANTDDLKASTELIANQLRSLGILVSVQVFELGTLNEHAIQERDFEALLFGQVLKHDTDIFAFWHSSQRLNPGLNILSYSNKSVDTWLESAIKEPDEAKRFALYESIRKQLAKDAPVVFLYAPQFLYVIDEDVHNISIPETASASRRFSEIHTWFINTNRVWNFFITR